MLTVRREKIIADSMEHAEDLLVTEPKVDHLSSELTKL
jgi:hypothetical protein